MCFWQSWIYLDEPWEVLEHVWKSLEDVSDVSLGLKQVWNSLQEFQKYLNKLGKVVKKYWSVINPPEFLSV